LHRNAERCRDVARRRRVAWWRRSPSPFPRWRGPVLRRRRSSVARAVGGLPAGTRHRGVAAAGGPAIGARIRCATGARTAVLVFLPELQCVLSTDADMSRAVATGARTTVLTAARTGLLPVSGA